MGELHQVVTNFSCGILRLFYYSLQFRLKPPHLSRSEWVEHYTSSLLFEKGKELHHVLWPSARTRRQPTPCLLALGELQQGFTNFRGAFFLFSRNYYTRKGSFSPFQKGKKKKRKFIMCYDQSTRTRHQLTLCLLAVQFYHCPSEASVAAYTLTRRIRHVGFP